MKRQIIYRQKLAAIFLLAYIFIATPVQWWHHHKAPSTKSSILKISTNTAAGVQSEDCKICQHTYAVYLAGEVCFNSGISNNVVEKQSFFQNAYSSICIYNLSNKSPPQA